MSQVESRVGPQTLADGSQQPMRLGRSGEGVTQDLHGRFHEAVFRGNVYSMSTAAAGITVPATTSVSPIPATTGKPLLSLYNPANNGFNLSILRVVATTVSGTPAGPFAYNFCANAASNALVSTWTPGAGINMKTFVAGGTAVCGNFQVLTGGTVGGTMLRPMAGMAAVAVGAGMAGSCEDVAGEILVVPGNAFWLASLGAGTSHVAAFSITWEEIPV
jgi:hypothetical protein